MAHTRTEPAELSDSQIASLLDEAWRIREHAHVIGPTKVGCAVLGEDGRVYAGCNVEHQFRSHDIHAEINAIASMVAGGCKSIRAVAIAAQRERFTPCGACLDWIFQFGNRDCIVLAQAQPRGQIQRFTAQQLMPFYPI
jgi:cytidine deaminase